MCGMNQERTGMLSNSWKPSWLPYLGYNNTVHPITGPDWAMPCSYQVRDMSDLLKPCDSTMVSGFGGIALY